MWIADSLPVRKVSETFPAYAPVVSAVLASAQDGLSVAVMTSRRSDQVGQVRSDAVPADAVGREDDHRVGRRRGRRSAVRLGSARRPAWWPQVPADGRGRRLAGPVGGRAVAGGQAHGQRQTQMPAGSLFGPSTGTLREPAGAWRGGADAAQPVHQDRVVADRLRQVDQRVEGLVVPGGRHLEIVADSLLLGTRPGSTTGARSRGSPAGARVSVVAAMMAAASTCTPSSAAAKSRAMSPPSTAVSRGGGVHTGHTRVDARGKPASHAELAGYGAPARSTPVTVSVVVQQHQVGPVAHGDRAELAVEPQRPSRRAGGHPGGVHNAHSTLDGTAQRRRPW